MSIFRMTDPYGNPIVEWPKHYKPLPEGYYVVFVDDHFKWANDELDIEGLCSWGRYWVRRCAFAHYEKCLEDLESKGIDND